jgi:hypothetical protein
MARLPDSRKKNDELVAQSKAFVDHSIDGLRTREHLSIEGKSICTQQVATEVVFPSVSARTRTIKSATVEPLVQKRKIGAWLWKSGCCLHCGDELMEKPESGKSVEGDSQTSSEGKTRSNAVPIAKYKLDASYWVFGQYCSAPCALGYIEEHNLGSQVMTWTRTMLHTIFQVQEPMQTAPPRFMLQRYGGPLDTSSWKKTDFFVLKEPPLCTFAMYAECKKESTSSTTDVLLRGLRRPTERDVMPAQPTSTGREPAILRILAGDDEPSPKRTIAPKSAAAAKSSGTALATANAAKKAKVSSGLSSFLADE